MTPFQYQDQGTLEITLTLKVLGLFCVQIRKALELHEQMKQRMGVVVVGPSGSGKSTVWKLLKMALVNRGEKVVEYAMNPKAMPRTQVCVCVCVMGGAYWCQINNIRIMDYYL